jgi:hypothetical protein
MHKHTHLLAVFLLLTATGMGTPVPAYALGTETTIVLRPHCLVGYKQDNAILDVQGDPEGIQCPSFSVENPQTLRTPDLSEGDILDLDIVVENPGKAEISRVRSWLSYDPAMLRGDDVSIGEDFDIVTPGESTFAESEGNVKIEASSEGRGPRDLQILVARVQFTVLKTTTAGTVITFFDVQKDGHTTVVTGTGEEQQHLIASEPGALHVATRAEVTPADKPAASAAASSIASSEGASSAMVAPASSAAWSSLASSSAAPNPPATLLSDGEACITDQQCRSLHCTQGVCQAAGGLIPNGGSCGSNAQCHSGLCTSNTCVAVAPAGAKPSSLVPVGGSCTVDVQCLSNLCADGICLPSLEAQIQQGPPRSSSSAPSAAFGLLQVQTVRLTTEGTAVFLGWEPLKSSQLKAYNIYYGTTTGRYIQRKTVDGNVQSLAIRSLPEGTTYYFALRAVSLADQESAFSEEVAVTVGNPKTATAPLAVGSIPRDDGPGKNPLEGNVTLGGEPVPGETGIPSTVAVLILASAVIGTGFASRRQIVALTDIQQS